MYKDKVNDTTHTHRPYTIYIQLFIKYKKKNVLFETRSACFQTDLIEHLLHFNQCHISVI